MAAPAPKEENGNKRRERLNEEIESLQERIEVGNKAIVGLEKLLPLYGPNSQPWRITKEELTARKKNLETLQIQLQAAEKERDSLALIGLVHPLARTHSHSLPLNHPTHSYCGIRLPFHPRY